MLNTRTPHIDFDYWRQLAAEDPERFESMRKEMLEDYITSAPDTQQARLRGLQWRIDRIRDITPTPMLACMRISDMMWDTFAHLARGYQHPEELNTTPDSALTDAVVIPFRHHS